MKYRRCWQDIGTNLGGVARSIEDDGMPGTEMEECEWVCIKK